MKRSPFRLLAILAFVAGLLDASPELAAPPDANAQLSPQQQAQVAEARRLNGEVAKLYGAGKYAAALEPARKSLEIYRATLGDKHPDTIVGLNNVASLELATGDTAAAEPLFEQVVKSRRETVGEKHPAYALALNNLAGLYRATGEYVKAEPLYRQALEIRKQTLGEQNADYAVSLNNLSVLLETLGRYAEAEPLAQQSLAIRKQALGERHPAYANALNNLAALYDSMGEYAKAEPLYLQAIAIQKQTLGEHHPDYAAALNNLALLYDSLGEYAKAEPLYRQAMEIRKQALGEKNGDYAASLDNLAELYYSLGDYAQAEPLYRQALAVRQKSLGTKHPDCATSLNNLAFLYDQQGDFARAEPLYREALEIRKQTLGERHPLYATTLNNLAALYVSMGDFARAEPLARQAVAVQKAALGEKHPSYAASLSNLARLRQLRGDLAEAAGLYRQAYEIVQAALGRRHALAGQAAGALALLYKTQGDFGRAEPLSREAIEISKAALGENHPDYATALNNAAGVYQAHGDLKQARALYSQAAAILWETLGPDHPLYAKVLGNSSFADASLGDLAGAEVGAQQAVDIARRHLDRTAAAQSERQQLRMAEEVRLDLDEYLSLSELSHAAPKRVYDDVLAWKGGVAVRQHKLNQMRRLIADGKAPELAGQLQELTQATRSLASLSQTMPKPGHEDAYRQRMIELSLRVERLQQDVARAAGERREVGHSIPTASDLQEALPADAALVDLLEYTHLTPPAKPGEKIGRQRRFVAFVLHAAHVERVELGPSEPIVAAVEGWRANFGAKKNGDAANPGQTLRELVWDKVAAAIGDAKLVLISPDGATARFPWPALPGRKPGTYLLEDIAISVVPVPRLLPEMLANEPAQNEPGAPDVQHPSMLLVGDVDFEADPAPAPVGAVAQAAIVGTRGGQARHWPPLPGSRAEIAAIAGSFEQQFPNGRLKKLHNRGATKAALASEMPQHRFVHLATHGFFAAPELQAAARSGDAGDNLDAALQTSTVSGFPPGLLSGLVLAGANRAGDNAVIESGADNGILTALEVAQLDLSRVELASLSACETGLGESAGGEGVLGLQRAFQVSGAKSVVATLWTIRDDATRALMTGFYDNLWRKKMSKLEALRQAQLTMLREGAKMLRDGAHRGLEFHDAPPPTDERLPPYFWAAFVLSGDWR